MGLIDWATEKTVALFVFTTGNDKRWAKKSLNVNSDFFFGMWR
jgi:hypothetical protein